MDLSDLYSPEELAEKRIAFLERVLALYAETQDILELGKIVGHKLRGTGGTLGLKDLGARGEELQNLVNEGGAEADVARMLNDLKPGIVEAIEEEKKIITT